MDTNFLEYFSVPQDASSMEIKEELYEHTTFSLISPPVTPAPSSLPLPNTKTSRRKGSLSVAGPKRHRPYPLVNIRSTTSLPEELDIMSNPSPYGTWNHSGARSGQASRSHPPVERRTSDGQDQSAAYNFGGPFMPASQYMGSMNRSSDGQPITSSSTLTGAMGDAISHSRNSQSPASSHSGSGYNGMPNNDLTWSTSNIPSTMTIAMNNSSYPGVAGHGGLPFGVNNSNLDMTSMNDYTNFRHISPESASPHSPHYSREHSTAYAQQGNMGFSAPMNAYAAPSEPSKNDAAADEIRRLKRQIRQLEQERARDRAALQGASSGLPTNPPSAMFQQQWKIRTDARKKMFCSLNRAGNALCSWHDSRRERRVYPPRNAPAGRLNCGCTFEEALFEESLARHDVGSYLPGESVRMDPALRNPLLKLLQQRYGYKDGDFEHDPLTETWAPGESPEDWERKAQSGQYVRKRADNAH